MYQIIVVEFVPYIFYAMLYVSSRFLSISTPDAFLIL